MTGSTTPFEVLEPIRESMLQQGIELTERGHSPVNVWGALAEDALGHMMIEADIDDDADAMLEMTIRVLHNTMKRLKMANEQVDAVLNGKGNDDAI